MATQLASTNAAWLARHGAVLAIIVCLVFVACVRLRLATVPLERDEGEYAYAAQLILQGIAPYRLAYNMKFPGTYYAYSIILALFGQTAWGIHVGLLAINAATVLLLFVVGRRLLGLGRFPAAAAAITFGVFSLDRSILGIFAHATHFVLLPALAGVLVLARAVETDNRVRLVLAGALLGTAVLMKQQAFFFLIFGAAVAASEEITVARRSLSRAAVKIALLAIGGSIPFAIVCLVLYAQGVLGTFWFWTIQYARQYVSEVPLSSAWDQFSEQWKNVTRAAYWLWVGSGAGAVLLWLVRWPVQARWRMTAFLVASFLAICPGFYFREHYFILLLPALTLLVGVAVASLDKFLTPICGLRLARALVVTAFVGLLGQYVAAERDYLFSMPVRDVSRTTFGANPFLEAPEIARYIAANSGDNDRIAVVGSEPEIYFYANRKSATGYIYTYALMEPQPYASRMQDEMIKEIETAHPKYLVFVSVFTSWLRLPKSDARILDWATRYARDCYDQVGVADIKARDHTEMKWGADAAGYHPQSNNLVLTFRQKNDAPCTVPTGSAPHETANKEGR